MWLTGTGENMAGPKEWKTGILIITSGSTFNLCCNAAPPCRRGSSTETAIGARAALIAVRGQAVLDQANSIFSCRGSHDYWEDANEQSLDDVDELHSVCSVRTDSDLESGLG
jgi:hypothetical protein